MSTRQKSGHQDLCFMNDHILARRWALSVDFTLLRRMRKCAKFVLGVSACFSILLSLRKIPWKLLFVLCPQTWTSCCLAAAKGSVLWTAYPGWQLDDSVLQEQAPPVKNSSMPWRCQAPSAGILLPLPSNCSHIHVSGYLACLPSYQSHWSPAHLSYRPCLFAALPVTQDHWEGVPGTLPLGSQTDSEHQLWFQPCQAHSVSVKTPVPAL